MIKLNAKTLNIKNGDGEFESIVASGIKVDGEIDHTSNQPIANSAVAKALDEKFDTESIASNSEIDGLFTRGE